MSAEKIKCHFLCCDLTDSGPYATEEDAETAKDCGISVEELRRDRFYDDISLTTRGE